mmetsp:Transcript_11124/g.41567  ORF Transcript_11124/g.41567 Transcript_11124/m.41567 type:complete len:101 (-) Transcript_11124:113-415(-)|eukprot:scaffold1954_cov268-Pinguiococcus_pyrenoidosus.AAC.292
MLQSPATKSRALLPCSAFEMRCQRVPKGVRDALLCFLGDNTTLPMGPPALAQELRSEDAAEVHGKALPTLRKPVQQADGHPLLAWHFDVEVFVPILKGLA